MKKFILMTTMCILSIEAKIATDLIEKYGCTSCHQITGKKSAPAFRGVANRNLRFNGSDAKTAIIESIKKGSKGKYPNFNGAQMPPYPDLSKAELNTLSEWIISLGNKKGGMGRGRGKGRGMGISWDN